MDAPRRNAIIAFGSNLGDRAATIKQAANEVADLGGTVLLKLSPLYESAAVKPDGVDLDAPEYLNAVALINTDLPPEAWLAELNGIEHDHGRERHERWGDRTLDLDIIWMDGVEMETEHLTIPHPELSSAPLWWCPGTMFSQPQLLNLMVPLLHLLRSSVMNCTASR